MFVYNYAYVSLSLSVYVYIYIYIHTFVFGYMYSMCMYIYIYIHTYIYINLYVFVYITHIQTISYISGSASWSSARPSMRGRLAMFHWFKHIRKQLDNMKLNMCSLYSMSRFCISHLNMV